VWAAASDSYRSESGLCGGLTMAARLAKRMLYEAASLFKEHQDSEKELWLFLSLAMRPLLAVRHAAQRPPPGSAAHKPRDTHARGAPPTAAAHGPRLRPVGGARARCCAPARPPDRVWHAGD